MQLPRKIGDALFKPAHARYRVLYGGRGSGKSWSIAKTLLMMGAAKKIRVLCAREYQISMADSVHKLLSEQVDDLVLSEFYEVQKTAIYGKNGTEFIFRGLHHNANEIKSLEGVDYCWIEEAEKVSEESWSFLVPTIRKPESEIWVSFNPHRRQDPTYQRFIENTPPHTVLCKVNAEDNPWFPSVLKDEMEWDKAHNYDKYLWVWAGNPLGISAAQIFRGKYVVDLTPEPNDNDRLFYGADWGFANDPTAIIRCFIRDRVLYIDHESGGVGVEIDETPDLFRKVPGSQKWRIFADCARPETISYIRRQGFDIQPAPKWPGSVEDGIEYMKGFEKIVINPRCKKIIEEFELYQYKQDKTTGEILPIVVDAYNHYCISGNSVIETIDGQKLMKEIKPGDKVFTRYGYKNVLRHWSNGIKKTVLINDLLEATPDHNALINGVWVPIDTVRYGDVLLTTWNEKQQNTTDKLITDIQQLKVTPTGRILSALLFGCTDKYGKTLTAQFLKGIRCIISMAILQIIASKILSCLQSNNTGNGIKKQCHQSFWNGVKSILNLFVTKQKNGTGARPDANGTGPTDLLAGTVVNLLKLPVSIVEKKRLQNRIIKNIVQTLVNLLKEGNLELMILKKNVLFAVKDLDQINMQKPLLALSLVRRVIEKSPCEVFDIEVDGCHEFFADGVLVHNCDALRYALSPYIKSKGFVFSV